MKDLYCEYRSDAVGRYLPRDNSILNFNCIIYTVGDRDLVPKLFDYNEFNYNSKYFFLLDLLPKEIWYMIFEIKFAIEKMEYVTFYFTPEYTSPELLHSVGTGPELLLHSMGETRDIKLKYFKPNTIWGRMYNDFTDILSSIRRADTKIVRSYNMMISLKEFINRWYFFVKEMRNNYYDDKKLHLENTPIKELFFKGNYEKVSRYISLYQAINSKIYEFEEVIFNLVDVPEERNKKMIAKILVYDIQQYAFNFLYGYNVHLDEPIEEGWRSDFFEYYFEFLSWVKTCGIESQSDLVSFLEEYTETKNYYYYNPKWFEKVEDSDDFPLWVMIQEFC